MSENYQGVESVSTSFGRVAGLRVVPDAVDLQDFAGSLAELAAKWQQQPDTGEYALLREIVAGAVGVVPGCEYAALVVFDNRNQLVARAVSGPETIPMIALQNELSQGPCRDTAAHNLSFRAADFARDERWPVFAARAAEFGVGSMLCTPLMAGPRSYGSLSMASGTPSAFTAESESLASIFAVHAAIALAAAERQESLTAALETRDLIGQAKGILMGRYGLTADKAFSVLVRESKNHNIKLREVSKNLCATGKLPGEVGSRSVHW